MDTKKSYKETKCGQLLGSLSEYVDGELDDELCAKIKQHLDGCEDCRIVVDTLRKTVYLYHTTSKDEPIPEDIRQRLFKSLDIEDYLEK